VSTELEGRFAVFLLAVLLVAPFSIGMLVFADPIIGETPAKWRPIAPLASLPGDDVPHQFPYYRPHRDAWIRYPDQLAGYVFLRRSPDNNEVVALSATHHPVYKVPLRFDRQRRSFESVCWLDHSYSLTGKYLGTIPDRQDLAQYEVRVIDGYVWVAGLGG
jgi:hypothetical protein